MWRFNISGLQSQVVKRLLEDWAGLAHYSLPSPKKGIVQEDSGIEPWDAIEERTEEARSMDDFIVGGMPHGFFFQRLCY